MTLWSFIRQVLQDGKAGSCNAAVTNAIRYMVENGMEPPGPDSGEYCRARYFRQNLSAFGGRFALDRDFDWTIIF